MATTVGDPQIHYRPATATDAPGIATVHTRAFDGDAEARLVVALGAAGLARVSFVADRAGEIIGHILFSEIRLVDGPREQAVLSLAPLAVLPAWQNHGVGTRLVECGLVECRQSKYPAVLVLGHPHYYPRFGFSTDLAAHLDCPYAGPSFMGLEMVPAALRDFSGKVVYSAPFQAL